MVISVAALQYPLGQSLTLEDILHLFRRRPDFVCLPEYFAVAPGARSHADGAEQAAQHCDLVKLLSHDLSCVVIGGTIAQPIEGGYANLCPIFDSGKQIGTYQKMNPVGREEEHGIVAGTQPGIFEIRGVKIGIMICADVLAPNAFMKMKQLGAEVIFAPTVSPYLEDDTVFAKKRRDQDIYVTGARKASAYVVKTCGVGTLFGGRLQGRSGIFAPWGILKSVTPDSEDRKLILTESLDLDEIREFKQQVAANAMASNHTPEPDIATTG